ncbi:MAG TPA: helix-turn-helix transcriptional regulator [Actinomycetes bacterium]
MWLLQGTAEWRHQHGSIDLTTDSLLLGRPGMVDSFAWDRARPTRHAHLHFRLDGRLPRLPDPALWPLARTLPADDPLRPLLTLFVLGPLPDRGGELAPPHLEPLLEYVRRAWSPPAPTRPLPLAELAAGACVSAGYLSRLFRQHYGVGPVAAFELLRLARAATLLARSNLSVAAVARDCGFANPYHFSRRFRRAYNQPPGRYRRAAARPERSEPLARAGLLPLADRIWRAH